MEIKKRISRNLALGEGPQAAMCARTQILCVRGSDGGTVGGTEGAAGDGRKAFPGPVFLLPLDSPGGGRAEQTQARRSRCVRARETIPATATWRKEEAVQSDWFAERKLLLDDWALCQPWPPANFHFQAVFVSAAGSWRRLPCKAHTDLM